MNNIRRLIDTVNYLLSLNNGAINYTKLIKMLYIADREMLIEYGFSITGDKYYSLPQGPILSKLYDLIKSTAAREEQTEWDNYFYKSGYNLQGEKTDRPFDELSDIEIDKLQEINERYKGYSFGQMIALVHDKDFCPEWDDPGAGRQSPLYITNILIKYGHKNLKTAQEILKTNHILEKENEQLTDCCL